MTASRVIQDYTNLDVKRFTLLTQHDELEAKAEKRQSTCFTFVYFTLSSYNIYSHTKPDPYTYQMIKKDSPSIWGKFWNVDKQLI